MLSVLMRQLNQHKELKMHNQLNPLLQAETSSVELDGETFTAGILKNWPLPAAIMTDSAGNLWVALDPKVVRQVRAQSSSYAR